MKTITLALFAVLLVQHPSNTFNNYQAVNTAPGA